LIYICIPAHDEAATVGVLLWKIRKVLGDFGREYRVVVLDDASSDGTRDVLERYASALPLTILQADEPLGYAGAVSRLLAHVASAAPYPKRDCAVVLQADFTEHPESIVELVKVLEGGADIVSGSPERDGPACPRRVRFVRWAAPRALGPAYRRAPVADPVTGLRAYRVIVLKKALRDLPDGAPLVRSNGWAANVELLAVLSPYARRITEVSTRIRYDLRARPSRFRPLRALMDLMRLRGRALRWPAGERAA